MVKNVLILLFFYLLAGCSKNNNADDKELPVIQLISPTNNQVFTVGQTVPITGTINDNNKLAELHVHISNNGTGQLLVDIHRYPAAAAYTLNENFQPQAGIVYKIQVIATDKSGNQQFASVLVSAN
jgi:Domain of unknown function (DUF4625)